MSRAQLYTTATTIKKNALKIHDLRIHPFSLSLSLSLFWWFLSRSTDGEDGQPRVLNTTILALKYESMWDLACQTILNDHVGATIKLPEYKPPTDRFSRLPQDEKDALLATYGPLRQKVNDAQACQVII